MSWGYDLMTLLTGVLGGYDVAARLRLKDEQDNLIRAASEEFNLDSLDLIDFDTYMESWCPEAAGVEWQFADGSLGVCVLKAGHAGPHSLGQRPW